MFGRKKDVFEPGRITRFCWNCDVRLNKKIPMTYVEAHKWLQCPECKLVSAPATNIPLWWHRCPACDNNDLVGTIFESESGIHVCTHCGKEFKK